MTDEIKDCPFCGKSSVHIEETRVDAETTWWGICCHDCGCQVSPRVSEQDAIAAWNTRTADKEIERLREALRKIARDRLGIPFEQRYLVSIERRDIARQALGDDE